MKKILFCLVGGYGDIIQSTNILKALKQRELECEITYATTTPYQQIMDGVQFVDNKVFITTENRHDSFQGSGKEKMESYIEKMKPEFDEIYFPQAAFHRDLLIKKNGWQVVKTMFELCGIEKYSVEPFKVVPTKKHIDIADKWIKENELFNRKVIFVEAESYSGQSFIHNQRQMVNVIAFVSDVLKGEELAFVFSAKNISFLPDDTRFIPCTLPLLCLLEIFKMTSIMISPHSGLMNLFACEYCYNPNKFVAAIMYDWQAPISIGYLGYPVINNMHYIFEENEVNVANKLIPLLREEICGV